MASSQTSKMLSLFRVASARSAFSLKLVPKASALASHRNFAADASQKKKGKNSNAGIAMNAKTRAELDALAKFDNYIDWEKFIAWLDAPEPADPRTAEEKAADAKVCRVYSKNAAKRYMQREKWLRSMLHCQMEAIANLPLELRASALVFDPILPPVHPRIGPPREYPIAAKIRDDPYPDEDENIPGRRMMSKLRRKALRNEEVVSADQLGEQKV